MSSSEEYLDNLLNALLGNEKSTEEEQMVEQDLTEVMSASGRDMPGEDENSGNVGRSENPQINSPAKESNKAMSTDEIEEMLASMEGSVVTSASEVPEQQNFNTVESEPEGEPVESDTSIQQPDMPTSMGRFAPEDLVLDEMLLTEEPSASEDLLFPKEEKAKEISELNGWALEEAILPREPETEEVSEPDSWALEEELLPEEPEIEEISEPDSWALEEELLPEESAPNTASELNSWALEEELLPEEAETEGISEPDSWALEEELLPEEAAPDTTSELNGWALEEELLPEEAETEGISEPDSWALEEELLPEEPEADLLSAPEEMFGEDNRTLEEEFLEESEPEDMAGDNDWTLEEELLPGEPEQNERSGQDGWNLEEEPLPEQPESEERLGWEEGSHETEADPELKEWDSEEDVLAEDSRTGMQSGLEDWGLEESALAERMPEEMATEEGNILSGFGTEEEELAMTPETGVDASEDVTLTDLGADSPGTDIFGMEADGLDAEISGMEADGLDAEISGMEAGGLDAEISGMEADGLDAEISGMEADGLDADIFGMDADAPADSIMSEEEVDRLLGDDFALEEPGEADEGLSELLESMGHDEDLSEINDLLQKADRGVMEDDDMMALLGNPLADEPEESNDMFDFWGQDDVADIPSQKIPEIVPKDNEEEDSDKKDKKKKKGKKAGKKNMQGGSEQGNTGDEKVKKKGVLARLLESLLEDEEELPDTVEESGELGSLSAENAELLAELNAEDKKNSAKKDKKKKAPKKKDKKEKKPKKAPKPKKPKKEKKPAAEENRVPEKKISRTKIVFVYLFCTSVAACIIVVNTFMPDYMQKQEAREMYEDGQYEETYGLLYGKELNEEEAALFQKSNIILQVRRKLQSYETYHKLDMQSEALNALIEGVERYQMFRIDAEQYGVTSEIDDIYTQILSTLSENYGLSEADALNILASESDLDYSEKIYGIINGTGMESTDEEQAETEQDIKQDVLPEEEEIIDRLENPEVSE